jgi:putative ABC transport system substrate-binding protein
MKKNDPIRKSHAWTGPPVSEVEKELKHRRELIRMLAVGLGLRTLAVSAVGSAQQPQKVHRVGFLRGTAPRPRELEEFRRGLRELGYAEGENIVIEQRYARGALDRLSGLAAELVRLKVDVIVVGGTHDATAAKSVTTAIPIIFTLAGDPVGSGLVVSLARPGGNVTGLANLQSELGGKQLQMLNEAVPHASRVAVLYNPTNPTHAGSVESARAAGRLLSVQIQAIEVRRPGEFAGAFAAVARGGAGALLVLADPIFGTDPPRLARLSTENRLPAMFFEKVFVDAGGLMSFGPDIFDQFHRAAIYVDKILKGTKPADIPVEQPTRFRLAINMKTAKMLGIVFPASILIQATEVVQ